MMKDAFDAVIDKSAQVTSRVGGDEFLAYIRHTYGLTHVAYAGFNIPVANGTERYFHNTYSDTWRRYYHSEGYLDLDPIIQLGLTDLLPQDWSDLAGRAPRGERVMRDARDAGIGRAGLSVPIRGMHGETAIFSVSADLGEREWSGLTRLLRRDLQVIAFHFHQRVLELCGFAPEEDARDLSSPEIEVLRWAAAGKSAWDTSVIMSISQSTVKFHLSNARTKLHAVTTTQAVARALSSNRIKLN